MSTKMADMVGQTIAGGRYEIRSHIGTGSMGHVYRAFDQNLETFVCVKIPTGARLSDPDFAKRFELESRFLVRLQHPQVVNIIDVGFQEGVPYIVMQFVGGGTLLDKMEDANGLIHPCPMKGLKNWLPSVGKALDFMHSKDCIHRDVKPANILFDEHNNAYLSDFGLSKLLMDEETAEDNRMTAKGAVVGTPNYVAPEIVLGRSYDGRADQYSLAITAYEYLTAHTPMEGPTASATMVNQTTKQPPPLTKFVPSIPVSLNSVILKAMSKTVDKRYPTCEEFADAAITAVISAGSSAPTVSSSSGRRSTVSASGLTDVKLPPKFIATKTSKAISPGKIPCPKCGKNLIVSSEYAGQFATCSGCSSRLRISNDVEQLSLLEPNPNYNSKIHKRHSHESDQFETILKTEVFGLKLSERQAALLIGLTLDGIMVGGVWFGIQFNNPSAQQTTLQGMGKTGTEGADRNEAPRIPVVVGFQATSADAGWYEQQLREFNSNSSITAEARNFFQASIDDSGREFLSELIVSERERLPDVISLESAIDNVYLERDWRSKNPETRLYSREDQLYSSPLVCLMWQARANEFIGPDRPLNFNSILSAAGEEIDWATIAERKDWGLFHFAMPSFKDSRWGELMLLTAAYQALNPSFDREEASEKTIDPLERSDVSDERVREMLVKMDKLALKSTGSQEGGDAMDLILQRAIRLGPDYADVLIVTEQAALNALPALESKWGFVNIAYLDPAPRWSRNIGITSSARESQQKAADTFLNNLLSTTSMKTLAESGLRPGAGSGSISVFDTDSFFRYEARLVGDNGPPPSAPLPSAEVIDTLKEIYRRLAE